MHTPLLYPLEIVFPHQPLAAVVAVISRFLYYKRFIEKR